VRNECRAKVAAELGRPLDKAEERFVDQAIVRQLRAASSRNRAAYKAMSYSQRIRLAGNRAAAELRGYRYKGDAWSDQDKADLKASIEREVVEAGGKLDVILDDDPNRDNIAEYQDRVISIALNSIAGKTVNGIMKALQGTLSHELLHWARAMGFYSPDNWAELVTAARSLKMSKGGAERTGKIEAWEAAKRRTGKTPTYRDIAAEMYGDTQSGVQDEEAVAMAMEAARARIEQETPDANDYLWKKAIGAIIRAGRAVAKAIGKLTQSKQAALKDYIDRQQINLRSGATSRQAPAFSQNGLEQSERVKVEKIKDAVLNQLPQEEVEDLVRRIEDQNTTAAEIAAAPIWQTIAEMQDAPTVTGEQITDPTWWDEKQYPHPDGSDQLISPYEMAEYIRSSFEGRAAKKLKSQRRAVIVTGAPGAGKSNITQQIARKAGAAVVEADTVLPLLPENNEGLNGEEVWAESAALTLQAVNWMTADGVNIVHERIGDDIDVLQKYVDKLKSLGYTVDIVHVRSDFTTRMRRMGARFLATGRSIPIERMVAIGNRPTYTHRTVARLNIGDGFYEVESGRAEDRRYRIVNRSGKPSPGTVKGVNAASGGGMARVGGRVFGQRPTPGLKEKALDYARLFQEWNKTAGFSADARSNFGGVKAKGADLTALSAAKQMAAEGVDANTIKQKTGWFRPKDGRGKWRFALASGEIKFKPAAAAAFSGTTQTKIKLGDLIESPILDHYPSLKKATVYIGKYESSGVSNRFTHEIAINRSESNKKEILAHEIQHIISGIERFERGGSPKDIAEILRKGKGWNKKPPDWAVSTAQFRHPDASGTMARALSLYLALVDEIQARDAERMVDMTPAERAEYEPGIMVKDSVRAEEIQNAWEHLQSIPLKLLAAIPPTGLAIYELANVLVDFFSARAFTPKDAFDLPAVIGATEEGESQPLVHQEFGLTREQSVKFDKMRSYAPVAKAMDAIGLAAQPKRITRQQYAKLMRALAAISDEDFVTDDMSAAKRLLARRQVQAFLKEEKAFRSFLENGIMDGGFIGADNPTGLMESRKYTPPGGRFGASTSNTPRAIIGDQPGYLDDAAYVAAQVAAKPTTKGIGGTTIQDKRMKKLKPWNVALGKLDEVDKLVEGSLKAFWKNLFMTTPVLSQIAGKASRYFQFGGVPDQAALEIYRSLFQGRVGQAEELAVEMAKDVSRGLNISYGDALKVLRGDMSGLAKLDPQVRAQAKDQMYQLKKAMTEEDPAKQQAMLNALPAELKAAGLRAMQAIQEVGDALVEHKIISAKQRDKWNGHYLFRAYIEHIDSYNPTTGTRASGAPYRAWRDAIPKDKRLTKGEIEDLPFLLYMSIQRPLRDIAAYSYLNALIHHNMTAPNNPRWLLPESLVMFGGKWRSLYYISQQLKMSQTSLEEKRAELLSIGGVSATGKLATDLRAEIRLLERVINDMKMIINTSPEYAQALSKDKIPDGYRQLPLETSRYGDAAGAIVIDQLYSDITGGQVGGLDPDSVQATANELYQDFNRNVKFLLTVANPPTHLRNIYSNMLMLARSGTNPARVIEAIIDIADDKAGKRTSPAVAAAKKFGAMKQTFTEAELRVLDQFARNLKNEVKKAKFRAFLTKNIGNHNAVDKALEAMNATNAIFGSIKNAYGDGMSWLYQMEDVIFKVAKIADELDRGTPEALAAMEARKYFFDYSSVTPFVRWLSNSALAPFIRYTYFAVPNFVEQVFTSPWRLGYTGYGQYLALMALATMLWGFAPDDAKRTLNEFLEKRPMMIPVPWRDEHGRIQWIDLGYMLPEGALWGAFSAATQANPIEAAQAFGLSGGPLMTIAAGWMTGVDPFRGQPIYEETDDEQTRAAKMSWFALRSMMPSSYSYYLPPLPGETKGGPGYEALLGTGEDRYGEPTQTGGQLLSRALGVNVYPNDVVYGADKRMRSMRYAMDQVEREMDRTYAAEDLTEDARERRIAYLTRRYDQLMTEYDEYISQTAEAVEAEARRQRE